MVCRFQSSGRFALTVALSLLLGAAAVAANRVPAELPRPDAKAPASDKPVKIYILSGQSNSLGFGRADGGSPTYPSIYLSPDPRIKTSSMPVGNSGLLPMNVFQSATGDARGAKATVFAGSVDQLDKRSQPRSESIVPLGDVSATLPSIDGQHCVVVGGFIEVPITGEHEVRVGSGDSSYAIANINGQEVYRKVDDADATVTRIKLAAGKRHPIRITYLKGGSTVFWMKLVDIPPKGTLAYHIKENGRFTTLVDDQGEWIKRNDVMFCDAYMGKGKSGPLSAVWRGGSFGPELGFGWVMGTFHDEPVIVMKADIGNRSLGWDCLPPGSKRFQVGDTLYAGYGDGQSSWPVSQGEPTKGGWYAGKQYDDYTASIHDALNRFDELFPQYKDQGYEIAGFVWWQGHKDQNEVHASRYEQNLINLIEAWRKEFKAPDAKFAIATIAFDGWNLSGPGKTVAEAQLAVGDYDKYPQHKGNVATIEARDFWRSPGESPKNQGYHYNHNGETYFLVGDALGRAMVEMHGGTAEPRNVPKPKPQPTEWPENPTLADHVAMLYTDAFISPWNKSDAEPTAEDMANMAPALRPIMMDEFIPNAVAAAPGTPAYRRHGASLMPILTGDAPKKPGNGLRSQLDLIISYYNAAGIDDYNWKPFTPKMQTAEWHYFSFDPDDGYDKPGRYRKVDMPKGMENWYANDFDPAKAGWKTGKAPFGQRDGKLAPVRGNCRDAQCECDTMPNTLWEHEVLLMRQTFKVPPLKAGHRYRVVVGGGNGGWNGEGYALYVNGRLFSELTGAFYKNGGERGAYILNDFKDDFASGEVTIAVKGFLRMSGHRGKFAPPSGQLSVWLEEVKLAPPLLKLVEQAKK